MVTTELAKTETVTVTLQAENGFAGDVTVAARLVDAGDVAVPNVMVTGPMNVTLTENGTGTAAYEIKIPMNATGSTINGMFKVELMSSAGNQSVTSMVTINAIYTIDYANGTGATIANHMNTGNMPNLTVKRGAILRFHNSDIVGHVIHGGGVFPHENTVSGGAPNRNYDIETIGIAPGGAGTLGCHDHGTATYSTYTVQ